MKRPQLRLALRIQHFDASPLVSQPTEIAVGSEILSEETDAQGTLVVPLPLDATSGRVIVEGRVISLEIGGLDPIDSEAGVDQRLANLGYLAGPLDRVAEVERRLAPEEFQHEQGIPCTGGADAATRAKLVEVHGI